MLLVGDNDRFDALVCGTQGVEGDIVKAVESSLSFVRLAR